MRPVRAAVGACRASAKREAVLRLLRCDDLDTVSRSLGVMAVTLSTRREAFLAVGEASLTIRPAIGEARGTEWLKARQGEMLLEWDLLESGRPLAQKRSRR
jgi:transposase